MFVTAHTVTTLIFMLVSQHIFIKYWGFRSGFELICTIISFCPDDFAEPETRNAFMTDDDEASLLSKFDDAPVIYVDDDPDYAALFSAHAERLGVKAAQIAGGLELVARAGGGEVFVIELVYRHARASGQGAFLRHTALDGVAVAGLVDHVAVTASAGAQRGD
jgi:hypothetical protein